MQINAVLKAVNEIASGSAYLVGGSVRDLLLGHKPRDIDLVVPGSAKNLIYKLAEMIPIRPVVLSLEHDITRAVLPGGHIDITGFGSHDLLSDLKRRDFTINAMALSVQDYLTEDWESRIIDPLGGLADLRRGMIRACTPDAFSEDPIRVLRAARLKARLGFGIAPDTVKLMQDLKKPLSGAPGERVWEELRNILEMANAAEIINFLAQQTQALVQIFPEINGMRNMDQNYYHADNVWDHCYKTLLEFEHVAGEGCEYLLMPLSYGRIRLPVLKLACLFHDVGKLKTRGLREDGRITFYGHHQAGGPMAEAIGHRLKMSKREAKLFRLLVEWHMQPLFLYKDQPPSSKAIIRFFRNLGEETPGCLLLSLADVTSSRKSTGRLGLAGAYAEYIRTLLTRFFKEKNKLINLKPLITGKEICNILEISSSPLVGKLIEVLKEAQIAGEITTREDAVQFLIKGYKGGS